MIGKLIFRDIWYFFHRSKNFQIFEYFLCRLQKKVMFLLALENFNAIVETLFPDSLKVYAHQLELSSITVRTEILGEYFHVMEKEYYA